MAQQKQSVVDDVVDLLAERADPPRWFHRVAPEHLPALKELKDAWLEGKLGSAKRTAAKAISKILRARGIATVGEQGVDRWLGEKA